MAKDPCAKERATLEELERRLKEAQEGAKRATILRPLGNETPHETKVEDLASISEARSLTYQVVSAKKALDDCEQRVAKKPKRRGRRSAQGRGPVDPLLGR